MSLEMPTWTEHLHPNELVGMISWNITVQNVVHVRGVTSHQIRTLLGWIELI